MQGDSDMLSFNPQGPLKAPEPNVNQNQKNSDPPPMSFGGNMLDNIKDNNESRPSLI